MAKNTKLLSKVMETKEKKEFERISFKLEKKYINIFKCFSNIDGKTKEKLLTTILDEVNFLETFEDIDKEKSIEVKSDLEKRIEKKQKENVNTFENKSKNIVANIAQDL